MRLVPIAILAMIAATPAFAQVRQGNPDAANESFARQGESRALQQTITSQNNATRMEIQRSQQMQPVQTGPGVVVAPRR